MEMMIDIETLATTEDAALVSVAAVAFTVHDEGGELFDLKLEGVFYRGIDLEYASYIGRIDPETIKFWKTAIFNTPDKDALTCYLKGEPYLAPSFEYQRVTPKGAMNDLHSFIRTHDPENIWANSPSFDMIILERQFRMVGGKGKLSNFRAWKDIRTLNYLASLTQKFIPTQHKLLYLDRMCRDPKVAAYLPQALDEISDFKRFVHNPVMDCLSQIADVAAKIKIFRDSK